ncbi:MAG: hypothetical protein RBR95_00790 [Ignavibacteriaceae bacterium]|jgi:hypothetical protein|nr:hypothetical protein [Ignavibacteriaceae bacterium]
MASSLYKRLFNKQIPCPRCGCGYKWAVNPVAGSIWCYNTSPDDPKKFCEYEYRKEEVFTPEQMIMFDRIVQITRLFTAI